MSRRLMRRVRGSGWPPVLECRCCGAKVYKPGVAVRAGIERLAWGSLTTCPIGCTREALRGKLEAEKRGKTETAEKLSRRLLRRGGK